MLRTGQGPDVVVLPRGSADLLRVSLWLDTGSRDTDPPQAATVAAWLAAEAAGRTVEATVFPDATEFSADCPKAELATCLQRISRALRVREVAPDALARAAARLIETRRKGESSDPERSGDRLALTALFGESGLGLFPLGQAADDDRLSPERVKSVLAERYATSRALLVIAGDIAAESVVPLVADNFAGLQRGALQRPATAVVDGSGVAVEIENRAALSIAIAASSLTRAQAAADALRETLERAGLASQLRAHAFTLRGTSIALLRLKAPEPLAVVRAAAQQLRRFKAEGLDASPARAPAQDAVARSRRVGLRWAAGILAVEGAERPAAGPRENEDLAVGVGVATPGGRVDRVGSSDPDAALRTRWLERAKAAWEAGQAQGEIGRSGDADNHAASVTLDNGARIELRREQGEQVAVAIRFACGGRCDPPLLHGRAALLATLTANACDGMSGAQLLTRLRLVGAELQPRVDAESWGLLLTAPGTSWRESLTLALDCALRPTLDRAQLGNARLLLRQRLGARGGPSETHARVAQALAPGAPGLLAPWGDAQRQNSVSLNILRELWGAYGVGAAVSVAAVGPVDIEEALDRTTRRLSGLQKGPALRGARLDVAAAGRTGSPAEAADRSWGVAVWRVPDGQVEGSGARAFAALMRATLGRLPGWVATWHDGGSDREIGTWAAVALSTPAIGSEARVGTLRSAAAQVGKARVIEAADHAFALERRARAQQAGSPSYESELLARAAFLRVESERSSDQARRAAMALLEANPVWLSLP